jgi:hypothetical protein
MYLKELQQRLHSFSIHDEVAKILSDNTKEMETLNRGQLSLGVRTDGSEILPSYTPLTIEIKKEKGQPFDHVYLKDTGDFWNRIKMQIRGDKIVTDDSSPLTTKLEKKYNTAKGKILGLNQESRNEFTQYVFYPELQKVILQKLGLQLH